jgi:hypothetical protein
VYENSSNLALVHECQNGPSLKKKLETGWKPSQAEVSEIALGILQVLQELADDDLHHGYICPETVLLRSADVGSGVILAGI